MTTESKRILGKNPNRRKTKGASGTPGSKYRTEQMMERYNEEFTKKLEKMRAKNEQKIEKKEPENPDQHGEVVKVE